MMQEARAGTALGRRWELTSAIWTNPFLMGHSPSSAQAATEELGSGQGRLTRGMSGSLPAMRIDIGRSLAGTVEAPNASCR